MPIIFLKNLRILEKIRQKYVTLAQKVIKNKDDCDVLLKF